MVQDLPVILEALGISDHGEESRIRAFCLIKSVNTSNISKQVAFKQTPSSWNAQWACGIKRDYDNHHEKKKRILKSFGWHHLHSRFVNHPLRHMKPWTSGNQQWASMLTKMHNMCSISLNIFLLDNRSKGKVVQEENLNTKYKILCVPTPLDSRFSLAFAKHSSFVILSVHGTLTFLELIFFFIVHNSLPLIKIG